MTAVTFTFTPPKPWEPQPAEPALETVCVSRSVLQALVASAKHLTERYDVTLGNTNESKVSWQCRADCPVCLAKDALGDEGLL